MKTKAYLKGQYFNIFLLMLLILLSTLANIGIPIMSKYLIDDGLIKNSFNDFNKWAIYLAVCGIFNLLFSFLNNIQIVNVGVGIMFNIRQYVANKLSKAKLNYYLKHSSSEIASLLNIEIEKTQFLYASIIPELLKAIILSISIGFSMYKMNPTLSLYTLLFLPVILINSTIGVKIIDKKQTAILNNITEKMKLIQKLFCYEGQSQYRMWGVNQKKLNEFNSHEEEFKKILLSKAKFNSFFNGLSSGISFTIYFSVYYIGGAYVLDQKMQIGSLFAFSGLLAIFNEQIKSIADMPQFYSVSKAAFKKLESFLQDINLEIIGKIEIDPNKIEKIEINNFSIKHNENTENLFENINFQINKNEKIAIIGESGCGKSTLVNCIAGLNKDYDGSIKIADKEVKNLSESSLTNSIVWVSQKPFIENISLIDNLSFKNKIGINEARSCFNKLGLDSSTENLHKNAGENGNALSGGQQQRISLARAFFKNAPIVILDEITSGLDSTTSDEIAKSIRTIFKDSIVLYISHNHNELKYFDRTIEVKNGKLSIK